LKAYLLLEVLLNKQTIKSCTSASTLFVPEIIEGVKRVQLGHAAAAAGSNTTSSTVARSSSTAAAATAGPYSATDASPDRTAAAADNGGAGGGQVILRPSVDDNAADAEIIRMMTKCWAEDPLDRPDFSALKVAIRKLNK
jgi:hypothetical protein